MNTSYSNLAGMPQPASRPIGRNLLPAFRFALLRRAAVAMMMIVATENAGQASTLDDFVIQPERSHLTFSGQFRANAIGLPWGWQTGPFVEQSLGSAITGMAGTIRAEVSEGAIRFSPIGVAEARTNGIWQPDLLGTVGSAPANCAVKGNAYPVEHFSAIRDLCLNFDSGSLPLQNDAFDARRIAIRIPADHPARFDSSISDGGLPLALHSNLTGEWTNQASVGTLVTTNLIHTLTLPINFSSNCYYSIGSLELDFQYCLSGQLTAIRTNDLPLRILSMSRNSGFVSLSWQSRPGRTYRVESTTNFLTWRTNAQIQATGPVTSFTTSNTNRFESFRVAR